MATKKPFYFELKRLNMNNEEGCLNIGLNEFFSKKKLTELTWPKRKGKEFQELVFNDLSMLRDDEEM